MLLDELDDEPGPPGVVKESVEREEGEEDKRLSRLAMIFGRSGIMDWKTPAATRAWRSLKARGGGEAVGKEK